MRGSISYVYGILIAMDNIPLIKAVIETISDRRITHPRLISVIVLYASVDVYNILIPFYIKCGAPYDYDWVRQNVESQDLLQLFTCDV